MRDFERIWEIIEEIGRIMWRKMKVLGSIYKVFERGGRNEEGGGVEMKKKFQSEAKR